MTETFASSTFLGYLKALYPDTPVVGFASEPTSTVTPITRNRWYIVAAVAYCAGNRPEGVPRVLEYVLQGLEESGNRSHEKRLRVVREMRDAIFKAGMTCGYAKAINALKELYDGTPDDLRDTKMLRAVNTPMEKCYEHGSNFATAVYGDSHDDMQKLCDAIYPDLGWFVNTVAYGITYGETSITNQLDTVFTMCASLIATDVPKQVGWHLANAMRPGSDATLEEVKAVRTIAMDVARECGVVWRNDIPGVKE